MKGVRGSLAEYPGMKKASEQAPQESTSSQVRSKSEDTGMSFGQSAGLKDDLDVDDNDVGKFPNNFKEEYLSRTF